MRRNKVITLPKAIKAWLDRALTENGFAQYEALSKALSKKGYHIGKSALHRYGQKFQQRVHDIKLATEMAAAIVESSPDDDNSQNEALIRLVQQRLMHKLVEIDKVDDPSTLVKITRAIADIARASVNQKRFREEVMQKAKGAAEKAEKIARRGGLTEESVQAIRREILGIAE
jgi:hypothetical protein